jgi:hypothetical protein
MDLRMLTVSYHNKMFKFRLFGALYRVGRSPEGQEMYHLDHSREM